MRRLCVVGISHRTAPVALREQLAVPDAIVVERLLAARALDGVQEALLLNTCNRVELYAVVDNDELSPLVGWLANAPAGGQLAAQLRQSIYRHESNAALHHLFRVASSLDSLVVGEPQILGQVKQAFQQAVDTGTAGPLLSRALSRAFAVAKRVRSETEIARHSASVASAAVDLARHIFGGLEGREVLIVGAGKMGDLSARHLRSAGVARLTVVNRSIDRARALAERIEGQAAEWSQLDALLGKADIVLCSTGAPEPVITAEQVQRVMRARRGRWLFFIDIAVPRDVDPKVGALENVYLYDVDALAKVVQGNRADRAREASTAEALVQVELERYVAAERVDEVVPLIKALRAHFLRVAEEETARVVGRLGALGERERQAVAQLGPAIVNKLLHAPLVALKSEVAADSPDGAMLGDAVRALFSLGVDGDPDE